MGTVKGGCYAITMNLIGGGYVPYSKKNSLTKLCYTKAFNSSSGSKIPTERELLTAFKK